MQKLTARQQQVLDFINGCIEARGCPPTLREIGEHMGIASTNGVNDHLKALEKKGYLTRGSQKSRSLRLTHSPQPGVCSIPLVGDVAAGLPTLAVEHVHDTLKIDPGLLGSASGDRVFALRVKGESMIEDGIFDGDYVFVKQQQTARRGETVVAVIDGEATCKHFFREGKTIRLEPANATMEPIVVHENEGRDVQLLGVVVGVYRRM